MAKQLNELHFELQAENPADLPINFKHLGVVGSGDMEVILEKRELNGAVKVKVVTPITGYEEIWRRVLERFVKDTGLANASIEINDNNATPVVVSLRLRQAMTEKD